jgi:hypothetical protein
MTNIRSDDFKAYLETFHRVYMDKLGIYVPERYRSDLLRVQHLQGSKTVGYVSTTYGVGYEYRAGNGGIEVSFGSRRVDEFFYGHPRNLIQDDGNILIRLTGRDFRMISCTVDERIPLRLDGSEASVTFESLRWRFRGQLRHITYAEFFANRTYDYWTVEKAIERAMDEVLQASVYAGGMERLNTSVSDYLERFKKGHVLLLGDFSNEGVNRIQRITEILGYLGYYGFTLKDVREIPEYDLRQKLTAVAPICRFVVVDDSSRAGQAAELPIIEMLRVTAIIMRLRGSQSTFVTRGLSATSKNIKEIDYDFNDIDRVLNDAVEWAESIIGELQEEYVKNYPWRLDKKKG